MTWLELLIVAFLLWLWWAARHHSYLPEHLLEGPPMARTTLSPARDDTFDAGQFGTLRYDFKAYGGVQGRIPDPSDEMIETFMRSLRDIAREFGGDDDDDVDIDELTAEELTARLDDDTNLNIAEAQKMLCEAYGELCQGSPDSGALLALPLRVRTGFMQWLQRKLISGEASAAGTSAVPAARRNAG